MPPNIPVKKFAWSVSGQGRGLICIQHAIDAGLLNAEIGLIILDRPSPISQFAEQRGIPCYLIPPDVKPYHPKLVELLTDIPCDWMGLTFNRLLSADVLNTLSGRIFNVHFSLLPMFPGFGAGSKTLTAGMRMTGATIHIINANTDQGIILAQAVCAVTANDTKETLGKRMFKTILPQMLQVIRSIGEDELILDNDKGVSWPRAQTPPKEPTYTFPLVDADLEQFAEDFCTQI